MRGDGAAARAGRRLARRSPPAGVPEHACNIQAVGDSNFGQPPGAPPERDPSSCCARPAAQQGPNKTAYFQMWSVGLDLLRYPDAEQLAQKCRRRSHHAAGELRDFLPNPSSRLKLMLGHSPQKRPARATRRAVTTARACCRSLFTRAALRKAAWGTRAATTPSSRLCL